MPLERRDGFGLGTEELGVLGDAGYGEDLGEMGRETEGIDFLRVMIGLHEELNDESDPAGIDVAHLGEIEEDQLGGFFGEALIATLEFFFGGSGDVAVEAEDEHRVPGGRLEFVDVPLGFGLHERLRTLPACHQRGGTANGLLRIGCTE
jgi:hypothetical protein